MAQIPASQTRACAVLSSRWPHLLVALGYPGWLTLRSVVLRPLFSQTVPATTQDALVDNFWIWPWPPASQWFNKLALVEPLVYSPLQQRLSTSAAHYDTLYELSMAVTTDCCKTGGWKQQKHLLKFHKIEVQNQGAFLKGSEGEALTCLSPSFWCLPGIPWLVCSIIVIKLPRLHNTFPVSLPIVLSLYRYLWESSPLLIRPLLA